MRVRILNHDAYGASGASVDYTERYPVGSIHEVVQFCPYTGEVELGDEHDTFAPSEYELVGE